MIHRQRHLEQIALGLRQFPVLALLGARQVGQAPLVSVCIANHNGMEVTDDCLRSVLEQEGHIPLGILVHDDAPSDGLRCFGLTWH